MNNNYDFSVTECKSKLKQKYQSGDSFSDGLFDAKAEVEPCKENWLSSADYRQGYLVGIEEKLNENFAS